MITWLRCTLDWREPWWDRWSPARLELGAWDLEFATKMDPRLVLASHPPVRFGKSMASQAEAKHSGWGPSFSSSRASASGHGRLFGPSLSVIGIASVLSWLGGSHEC